MTKTDIIITSNYWKEFLVIMESKLRQNEHKTMDCPVDFFIEKIKEEFYEVLHEHYKNKYTGLYHGDSLIRELADLANMCFLTYMRIRGFVI